MHESVLLNGKGMHATHLPITLPVPASGGPACAHLTSCLLVRLRCSQAKPISLSLSLWPNLLFSFFLVQAAPSRSLSVQRRWNAKAFNLRGDFPSYLLRSFSSDSPVYHECVSPRRAFARCLRTCGRRNCQKRGANTVAAWDATPKMWRPSKTKESSRKTPARAPSNHLRSMSPQISITSTNRVSFSKAPEAGLLCAHQFFLAPRHIQSWLLMFLCYFVFWNRKRKKQLELSLFQIFPICFYLKINSHTNSEIGKLVHTTFNYYPPLMGFGIPQRTSSYIFGNPSLRICNKLIMPGPLPPTDCISPLNRGFD